MINESRLFKLFEDLCLINAPALDEKNSVSWTRNHLEGLGLECWEDQAGAKIGGNANNLIVKLPGNLPNAPKIFLSAHFDTVEPTEGLKIKVIDDVYYSESDTILGADDKAGMAPAIEAMLCMKENDLPRGDTFLVLCVAEEIGLKGAFACDIQELGLDFGYVFDTGPPVGSFVNHVGTHAKFHVKYKGKPAHAGKDPEHGISAIHAAGIALSKMNLGRIDEETTANVGQIFGGTATNVVPAEVQIKAEARSFDSEKLETQIKHMTECFESGAKALQAKVEIHVDTAYDGYKIDEDTMVVQKALRCAKKLGWEFPLRSTLGGSDANAFNLKGVPTIVCGTGMKEIHTHEEHVSKRDLVSLTQLAIELLRADS